MSNVQIVPAILVPSLQELEASLARVTGAARAVQIDVIDGRYVPNTTWPFGSGEQQAASSGGTFVEAKTSEPLTVDSGQKDIIQLPFAEEFEFEIDLMVERPLDIARAFIAAGAARIIIHADAEGAREALESLQSSRKGPSLRPVAKDSPLQLLIGVALSCDASLESLGAFEGLYDFVQVMGIEKVGFQGQPFDKSAVELVAAVHAADPDLKIQVDGAVGEETIPDLVRAGATRLIVGSRIFASDDPKEALRSLQMTVNSSQKGA
ncbi:MAG: hypothetical protein ACREGH_01190 [Minisyncoccia bacterium]